MSYDESPVKQVEIEVEIRADTGPGGAYRVYNGKTEAWVPRSQVSDHTETDGVIETIFIPEWLALEKNLI